MPEPPKGNTTTIKYQRALYHQVCQKALIFENARDPILTSRENYLLNGPNKKFLGGQVGQPSNPANHYIMGVFRLNLEASTLAFPFLC